MNGIPEPASMELPQPNLPLLRKVLDHIDAHPAEWDQMTFGNSRCGTPMCVGGWTLALSGERVAPAEWSSLRAGELLGLTDGENWDLFYETNDPVSVDPNLSAEDIRGAVQVVAERIAARAGERL